ncbi:Receptor-interacting serine/threonine-protein kinase 1 [Mortierella polycephala]|uniref:Receptor-interacting serine/threonine-protein kinase 1 n=1 Tax=Mortierella polycephala TaxID=41804 RepID=A0A9P6U6I9_9FUNG|nr:Receptor-interacting serine/threonine-protein kinase 1 [Mortierella polycephala]
MSDARFRNTSYLELSWNSDHHTIHQYLKGLSANLTDIHEDGALPPQALRTSQQAIIEAINNRRRTERSYEMMALARGSSGSSSSNHHPSVTSQRSMGVSSLPASIRLSMSEQSHRHGHPNERPAISLSMPAAATKDAAGFKIRIPRDLPNLPEVFRKRGAIRSQSGSSAPTGTANGIKRTHSLMMFDDKGHNRHSSYGEGPRTKAPRTIPLTDIPPHLAHAKNLAYRTSKLPIPASPPKTKLVITLAPSSASVTAISDEGRPMEATPPSVQRHRGNKSKSKSKSKSPSSTPVRIPSPSSTSSDAVVIIPSSGSSKNGASSHSHGTRSTDGAVQSTAAGSGAISTATTTVTTGGVTNVSEGNMSPQGSVISAFSESDRDSLAPIELIRVGMSILNQLLNQTFSKSFINKVPQSVVSYYTVIKKPMDLTTIEQKLWKTLELADDDSGASDSTTLLRNSANWLAMGVTESYVNIQEFERDLRRIFQNATFFNAPTHVIYKEAHAFQNAFNNLLTGYRQGNLTLNVPLSEESFSPELISLSEPGPLYIFRAHSLREMDRKMTDISTDLYASFHQPIFDIANEQIGQLSPSSPRFVRMYINKNRSILEKSRDELLARVAILTDVQVGKPFQVSNTAAISAGANPKSTSPSATGGSGRGKSESGSNGTTGGSTSMVRMTAKVLIGKPIGERHNMVTVGDLDCPNSWITVACVKAVEIDVDIPSKFEKGTLSKMRHEVAPFSSDSKISPEHKQAFAKALGLSISGKAGSIGQRSSIPIVASTSSTTSRVLGLGIAMPSSPAPTTTPGTNNVTPQKSGVTTRHRRASTATKVDVEDQGPNGRFLVKLRIPGFPKSIQRSAPGTKVSTSSENAHAIVASMPSSPPLQTRIYPLSSQVSATTSLSAPDGESQSAPDRLSLHEQITKRGTKILQELKRIAKTHDVPYTRWSAIEPTLTVDSAHGLFKRIYHVRGQSGLVVQNFKEMDAESFEQRVREVACLLKLRGLDGVGQIQSVIENEENHLVGLSMTKYGYTLKQYATNARRHPTPYQKLYLVRDMISAMCAIHQAGLAHRDLSEVNIMVDEDPKERLEDHSPKPRVKVIDFGKSVFVDPDEVQRWSMQDQVSKDELDLLPMVVLPPDHGYKLYRSILTLPKTKHDHSPLPPVDPQSEDVYSLGVLIWRTFSGKSPWDGTIEDDLKAIRYLVSRDAQIKFQLEREVAGPISRELLLHCLTAQAETRWTTRQLKEWLDRPEIARELLREFEALGGGRKKVRKNLD